MLLLLLQLCCANPRMMCVIGYAAGLFGPICKKL
jgi:hypothetical protein